MGAGRPTAEPVSADHRSPPPVAIPGPADGGGDRGPRLREGADSPSAVAGGEKAKARDVLHDFQRRLAQVKVLDPACGSGNFLAAAYDILKRLEAEVQRRLLDLGETTRAL